VPVVLAGLLVGLLAEGDLKRAQPSTLSDSQDEFTSVMEGTPISRIMIQSPLTVSPETPLLAAAETLQSTKYGALPVVEDGKVVGILTDTDLITTLVDLLRKDA
jgi:acetoin utilization protein AcuB